MKKAATIIGVLVVLMVIGAISNPDSDNKEITSTLTASVETANLTTKEVTTQQEIATQIPEIAEVTTELITDAPETKKAIATTEDKKEEMVWVSRKGKKYHSNPDCSNMKNPSHITLDEAISSGRGPCSKCY